MMPIRRMKIKAAPNIMGGIGKKGNPTNNSLNKDSFLTPSSIPQDSSSHKESMNISTVSSDNNKENFSLLKCDGGSPVLVIENVNTSKIADCDFCEVIPSSDKCLLINSGKEPEDYTTTGSGNLPATKQSNKLQLDLARRMKIKTAPNIGLINGLGKKINSSKRTVLNNNSALSSVSQESGLTSNYGSLSRPISTLASGNSRYSHDNRIVNVSNDEELAITKDSNWPSRQENENYNTSDISLPIPELNSKLQEGLGITNSNLCLESIPVSSSSIIDSGCLQGDNFKSTRNKCPKPKKIPKPRKPVILKKTSERNISKEKSNHVGMDDSNDDSFSIPSNLNSKPKGKKKSKEKYFFKERKLQYKQKMKSTNGNLEVNEMPLFYLIFHNPSTNPMPQRRQNERERPNSISSNAGSVSNEVSSRHTNRAIESDGITSETLEELRVEEQGLQIINEEVSSHSPEAEAESNKNQACIEDGNNDDDTPNVLAPQVKLGPDGNLIIDEKSLLIQTTAAKNRDKILSNSEVVEENEDSSHYGKWSKRRKRATEWTKKETARFYKALATVGTDFSFMSTVFAWRTRAELKIKFKKEERNNPHLVDIALNDVAQFDFSIFDESDYDPEEDRKESKEAKKAEAKRRKELEVQKRIEERNEERQKKKDQIYADKKRKKRLRELCNSRKKRKVEIPINTPDDSDESSAPSVVIEPQEVICEVVFSSRNSAVENKGEEVTISASGVQDTLSNMLHFPLPHDVDAEDKLTNTAEILASSARSNKMSSGNYLNILGIDVFEKSNHCPIIDLKELRDMDTLIVPIEDSYVDVMDASSKTEAAIEPAKSFKEKLFDRPSNVSTVTYGTANLSELITQASINTYSEIQTVSENMDVHLSYDHGPHTFPPMTQIILPISSVKKNPDGSHYVEIDTAKGLRKIEPVPDIPSGTSSIIVVFSQDPSESGEQVFHVYFVSPVASNEIVQNSEQMKPSSKVASVL